MKASIFVLTLLVVTALSQPVTKSEETPASKRTTVLTEVENIPDSESEASENKEKRGAARLTPVSSNSLTSDRPGQSNQHQNHQLAEIAQLTQIQSQSPTQQIFAPHPYSFILPYHQPKVTYNSPKSPYFLPQQQQQILQLPAFNPQQHQQYMLILPSQQSPAQHQVLMLIAPSPTASGFHYIAQSPTPHSGIPPQHLINFYAGQPQHHQQQSPIQEREQPAYQTIPQQPSQPIHVPSNQQSLQQNTRIYPQQQHHFTYQSVPQEQQQPLIPSQPLHQKHQQQIQQQQIQQQQIQQQQIQQQQIQQQQQQQQYLLEESIPTPAALVSSYGSRLHSQPSHHNQQQQYKTIIKV